MGRSNTAENAKLQYEAGQTFVAMAAMTDSGDATIFSGASPLWSAKRGYEAKVRPNGLITGGAIIPTSAQNDKVDVAALSGYLAGILTPVGAAAATAVTRGASTDICKISSITVTSAGAIAVVAGTAAPTFSETRAAAGGPPLVPVGSVEIGQVRLSGITPAVVLASEIFQVPGNHQERFDYPVWDESLVDGKVTFAAALPKIHTGALPKKVYAEFYTPVFADVDLASDFAAPENSHSVSSTQIYGKTLGKSSSSLGQGKFTAFLKDGVTDALVGLKDSTLWFKFFPDRYLAPYLLTQGKLGVSRTFPAGSTMQAACTISANTAATEVAA